MKILMITGGFPSEDKPQKSIFNLRAAKSLSQVADLKVVHYRFYKPGRPLKEELDYEGVKVIRLNLPYVPEKNRAIKLIRLRLWIYLTRNILRKQLRSTNIIHSVGLDVGGMIASQLSKKTGIPHFAQIIGSDINFHMDELKGSFLEQQWTRGTKAAICNSKAIAGDIQQKYPGLPTYTAYRGTDLEKFKPHERQDDKHLRILFLGGFAHRSSTDFGSNLKGGETLKKAWELLLGKMKLEAMLQLGGPESKSEKIIAWKQSLPSPQTVETLGELRPDEVPTYINTADIVVVPSLSEGLPNVAVEACAAGKLVIATRVGGIPEVIEDGKTGILINAADTNALADALAKAISSYREIEAMRRAARKRMEADFDSSQYAQRLMNIYKSEIK
ncbi:MAG TPA: hypothetical protein DDW81_08755 [Cryomorphaceae bacterium]|nr:hypothetical protein [Owenweeksia sp.]HBF20176.1 hypothetical protein [Cryomorphaceae bacterium]HCQ15943.1 hypothetical protein [Cryomorphaceae bacterium]|tara:strand:- start:4438 stop:5601 length:1164 start_codon:yes stop_codon:yes gene_type:complete